MNFFKKTLSGKIAKALGIALFMSTIINSVAYYSKIKQIITYAEQEELFFAEKLIQNLINNVTTQSAARAEVIANLPFVKKALRNQDRDSLISALAVAIEGQHDKYGVAEANFYLPPANLFLRLTELDKIEIEDCSAFRDSVVQSTKHGAPEQGLEIGRQGLDIRGIYPVIDEQGLIGAFEIGMSFEKVLQLNKSINGFDAGIFIYSDIYNQIATDAPKLDLNHHFGHLLNPFATNIEFIHSNVTPLQLAKIHNINRYITKEKSDNQHIGMIEIPLNDFDGNQIGVIVLAKNFENFFKIQKQADIVTIAFFLFQLLFLTGITVIMVNARIKKPLIILENYLKSNDKENSENLQFIKESNPDLSQLATEIEKFQDQKNKGE